MRVVAGRLRGRRIPSPETPDAVRPTSDRVREALFNAVGSRLDLHDAHVVDLFAGTGALGIEAWSRGASEVVFVERDRRVADRLRSTLTELGVDGRVVVADASMWTGRAERADLVLADPPYEFDGWDELLDPVVADLVVAESDRELDPVGWQVERSRRYGRTVVTLLVRPAVDGSVADGTGHDR